MIQSAEYKGDYKILVTFDDGVKKLADFYPFISTCRFAYVKKYLNKELFKQFYFNDWGLCWGDNEFDINPENIRNGKYDVK